MTKPKFPRLRQGVGPSTNGKTISQRSTGASSLNRTPHVKACVGHEPERFSSYCTEAGPPNCCKKSLPDLANPQNTIEHEYEEHGRCRPPSQTAGIATFSFFRLAHPSLAGFEYPRRLARLPFASIPCQIAAPHTRPQRPSRAKFQTQRSCCSRQLAGAERHRSEGGVHDEDGAKIEIGCGNLQSKLE